MLDKEKIKEYFQNTSREKILEEWDSLEDFGVTWEEYLKNFNAIAFISFIEENMSDAYERMGSTGDYNYYEKPHFNEENYYFGRFRALEDLKHLLESSLKNNYKDEDF